MASFNLPKKNIAFSFYVGLVDQSNTKLLKAAPTLASGDFKVSIDGGAFANLTTLPTVSPSAGRAVLVSLSTSEMNGDNIVVQCVDAAGAEWCDQLICLQTAAATGMEISGNVKRNTAFANFAFVMTDSTTHNPATGKTVTATRCIDSGTFAAGSLSAVTEISNGLYRVDLAASDLNGAAVTLRLTATGCDDLFLTLITVP